MGPTTTPGFMPPSTIGVVEEAQRVLTINLKSDGTASITRVVDGHSEMTREAFMPLNGGICKMVYQSNSMWAVREGGPLPAQVKIRIEQDGKYTIRFSSPPETTAHRSSDTVIGDCTVLPRGDPQPETDLT
jgi:flagellar basal body rod protein FlgF